MAKQLGPSFASELVAAGVTCVAGFPEGGTSDQIMYTRDATPDEIAEVEALVAAHNQFREPVPATITRLQFFKQCYLMGIISADESTAAIAKQALPIEISGAIDAIQDQKQRELVRMDAMGLDVFRRDAPFTEAVRVYNNWVPEQADVIWIEGAKL